ncbi:hypothetical protein QFC24_000544 [Naganishia onofrii]|uniref:Uncharacterized protein n=1 Tax=Naganishia onofrii TaxID=1851511 RepID=A0ACC2XXJ2_9TREE|nr:hypothetical protein QFC24_000544 [Naganishia onofrii]
MKNTTPDDVLKGHIHEWWRSADIKRTGAQRTLGWLRSKNIPCTRKQVRRVLENMRPAEHLERRLQAIPRKKYRARFVNTLWHIDGNHKLIRWKIVIHGGIDGASHLATFMTASDNNRALTVCQSFVEGAQKWGWPVRVRADYGGENLEVKAIMEATRRGRPGTFITGKSVHNQRIERLWKNAPNGFIRKFSEAFTALETQGALEPEDPVDLYCLHYVFLPRVRRSTNEWVHAWNYHPMSTKGLKGHSPIKQFRLG